MAKRHLFTVFEEVVKKLWETLDAAPTSNRARPVIARGGWLGPGADVCFLMYGLWPGCAAFVSTVFGWPALVAQYVFWPGADGARPLENMTSITN